MLDATIPTTERLAIAQIDAIAALHTTNPLRDGLTASRDRVFHVERPKSSFSAWYQFFPRSEGATVNERGEMAPGTLRTAVSGLERAKSGLAQHLALRGVQAGVARGGPAREDLGAAHDRAFGVGAAGVGVHAGGGVEHPIGVGVGPALNGHFPLRAPCRPRP